LLLGAVAAVLAALFLQLRNDRETPEAILARQLDAQVVDWPAPPLEAKTRDGSTVRLEDLRGKVVFVNFWATWCPPCRKEIPDLEQLAADLKGLPFEILAVSADQSWADVDAFFAGKQTAMRVVLDTTQAGARRYGTEKLPETYVVDAQGRVRLRFVGIQPWTDERIHRYLEWLASHG
jgi:thiol-disulfide isomerase/thioredoxin